MLRSGTESVPRQLTITQDRYPFAIFRSEDAKNAFPSTLRGKVIEAHLLLQRYLRSLPDLTPSETLLIALSEFSVLTYTVYRALPNNQWVNVGGTLINLPATGGCVQGGILDMSDFCILYTYFVLIPLRHKYHPRIGVLSIADDLYTEARNNLPPPPATESDTYPAPPDVIDMINASKDFIILALAIGIEANIPKVHTYQSTAAIRTPFDIEPHRHRFPPNPKPTELLPAILDITRNGFKVAGAWVGPTSACLTWALKVATQLTAATKRLLDPRLAIRLQLRLAVFRTCFSAQARLCHLERSMIISDILPALHIASANQHSCIRILLRVQRNYLPDDFLTAIAHPSLVVYSIHLPTDCGGCAITSPLLIAGAANIGAAISAQPVLHLSLFHSDLAVTPTLWRLSGVRILSEGDSFFTSLTSLPAFFVAPSLHPDRHNAFARAVMGADGKASISLIDKAVNLHPQACLGRTQNRQIFTDISTDTILPDLTRARLYINSAFNSGRSLIPVFISRDNSLTTDELLTTAQLRIGTPLTFIGPTSRCADTCTSYGPLSVPRISIPGFVGKYYVDLEWHCTGSHQVSCKIGSFTHQRHQTFQKGILESLHTGGAAISKDEIFVSPTDNKRADGCLWHPALSDRGIAIDVTVWNPLTLARLALSASYPLYTLCAAELFKTEKYETLCDGMNLDFLAFAAYPNGGFGPILQKTWTTVWAHRIATATAAGLPTRPIASQERRCLERIATNFARDLHRSIWFRTTSRYVEVPLQPEDLDGDAHLPADL